MVGYTRRMHCPGCSQNPEGSAPMLERDHAWASSSSRTSPTNGDRKSGQRFDAPPRGGIETIHLIMKDGLIYKNTL